MELSIVLVCLGLVAGTIMTSQSLIRASALRGIVKDIERFRTATLTFSEKYSAMPGDMSNATEFWGIAGGGTGNDATCFDTESVDEKTCNGNGDGIVGTLVHEEFRYWQHLANAGLIAGKYTGKRGPGSVNHTIIGENCPAARIDGAGYSITTLGDPVTFAPTFFGAIEDYQNMIQVGTQNGVNRTGKPFLTPEEAWSIDTKTDDGKPSFGIVRSDKKNSPVSPDCADSDDLNTAKYDLLGKNKTCRLVFKSIF